MSGPLGTGDPRPRLYHAPSSYYSMIARLALVEGGVAYDPVFTDIHVRMSQQQPDYVRLNRNMTVPTLVLPDRLLDQSRAIAEYAMRVDEATISCDTKSWLDLHYAYPIDELTFSGLLAKSALARFAIPRRLRTIQRRLLIRADVNSELAEPYRARAELFEQRARIFSAADVKSLAERRRAQAIGLMDRLEHTLLDGRETLVVSEYGVADVVWTVFLARMEFVGLGAELARRPSLLRYWRAMRERSSFAAADVWTSLHPFRLISGIVHAGGTE